MCFSARPPSALMCSQDGGGTWTAITSGLPTLSTSVVSCTDVAYNPSNANRAWCAFWGSGIYRTDNATDAMLTWTKLNSGACRIPTSVASRLPWRLPNHDAIFALIAGLPF